MGRKGECLPPKPKNPHETGKFTKKGKIGNVSLKQINQICKVCPWDFGYASRKRRNILEKIVGRTFANIREKQILEILLRAGIYIGCIPHPPKVDMGFDLGANNLCSLCFKIPEFVFPPFRRYSENSSGGCRNG